MRLSSIDAAERERTKTAILSAAAAEGFSRARVLAPFAPEAEGERGRAAPAALVVALPYGNIDPDPPEPTPAQAAQLDLFSRRNYYAETVFRLKRLAAAFCAELGGTRADYRVFCNSPIPEKPLAAACGLGTVGRNSLIITPEAGSLVVVGILTLPFALDGDGALDGDPCARCAACAAACPTGALGVSGDRSLDRTRCIQWYASRPGEVPADVAERWGDRLYGCSACRDACPANIRPIPGAATERGTLPAAMDAAELAAADDEDLRERFKGSALGMGWLGPEAIRRNALLALGRKTAPRP